jgi:hypothetical protein
MDSRIPEVIQPLLKQYIGQFDQKFPGLLCNVYLVGSIALGEFNPNFSDIDFVTFINRAMTASEVEALQQIHQQLEKRFPRWMMSGSYIQSNDAGKLAHEIQPHPHYHEGILHPEEQNEVNSVTWWELKNHGIALLGIAPEEFSFTVDWSLLVHTMMENLNTYWAGWASQPARIILLMSDWGVQWTVTGVLRQFYTLQENSVTTKIKAAEYALGCLPERWHPLIQDAIDIRKGNSRSTPWFKIARMYEAVRFLKFIIQTCNAIYYSR